MDVVLSGNLENMAFTWKNYQGMIEKFLDNGYVTCLYNQLDSSRSHLILRHDVDFSLNFAVDIAKIEAKMEVASSYFVLLRTEFYNLCSPQSWRLLMSLVELGHDVGLHFDASQYDQDIDSLEAAVAIECSILEKIIGKDVTTISFHRPAKALLGLDRPFAGRLHAYEPRFFDEIAYVSDSQGQFRYGHPLEHEAFASKSAMQLLTHPIWWRENAVENKMSLLDGFLADREKLLHAEMIANCKPFSLERLPTISDRESDSFPT
jgi:hypothetical protein